jgi:competence protein ComEC
MPRAAMLSAVAAGLWIVAMPAALAGANGDGRLHATFIDVGQGDAALVTFPRGSCMLIDAGGVGGGGSFDIGDRVVAPVARWLGVTRLTSIVLTHGDNDHIGGAPAMLREFRPWDIWEGVPVPASAALQAIRSSAMLYKARWTTVQRSDRVAIDEVEVRVWHPSLPDWERQSVRNNDSIVLELRWRDVSLVFSGDIGRQAEDELQRVITPAPLRIVKVPHHGSLTSSTEPFVRALHPDVAVVSVGRSNNFGHPSPVVLRRYQDIGAEVFRTDLDGAVMVDTDGRSLDVRTFTGRSAHLQRSSPSEHATN